MHDFLFSPFEFYKKLTAAANKKLFHFWLSKKEVDGRIEWENIENRNILKMKRTSNNVILI